MFISKLFGLQDEPYEPKFKIQCNSTLKIQKRTHKHKRINKKWLKRYGLTEIPIIVQGGACGLKETSDKTFEFTFYNPLIKEII